MYERNSKYFREMLTHIAAGEMKLVEARQEHEALAERSRASGDPIEIQHASDMDSAIAGLERRVHDLRLAAMISLQRAPQIRLVQNANQALVERLQTSVVMIIPMWKQATAMAIFTFNQMKASEMQKMVREATENLLVGNSALLKKDIAAVTAEMQRGIVSIDTLRIVNRELIDTIEASLRANDDGRRKRQQVEEELEHLQEELKTTLVEARSGVN